MNDLVHDWGPLIAGAVSAFGVAIAYYVRQEARVLVGRSESRLSTRIDQQHDRLTRIETLLEQMPSRADFHRLEVGQTKLDGSINTMQETVSGLRETINAARHSIQRVNDYLLDHKRP